LIEPDSEEGEKKEDTKEIIIKPNEIKQKKKDINKEEVENFPSKEIVNESKKKKSRKVLIKGGATKNRSRKMKWYNN